MNLAIRRIAAAVGGYASIVVAVYYFAWVASIAAPVNWNEVLSTALFMAPVGLTVAMFVDK